MLPVYGQQMSIIYSLLVWRKHAPLSATNPVVISISPYCCIGCVFSFTYFIESGITLGFRQRASDVWTLGIDGFDHL